MRTNNKNSYIEITFVFATICADVEIETGKMSKRELGLRQLGKKIQLKKENLWNVDAAKAKLERHCSKDFVVAANFC